MGFTQGRYMHIASQTFMIPKNFPFPAASARFVYLCSDQAVACAGSGLLALARGSRGQAEAWSGSGCVD